MGVVYVEGKPVTLADEIIDCGVETIRQALMVDFPDVENADIQIQKASAPAGAPAVVTSRSATVVRQATPKG